MNARRRFPRLTPSEREYLEIVLLEEMDRQVWFAVAYSVLFDAEVFVGIQ